MQANPDMLPLDPLPDVHSLWAGPMDADNPTVDGIEILVDLARRGRIDPWDIDVIDVSDQFLRRLSELTEQSLKLTGKTLLFAAVLLRMKSDSLSGVDYLIPDEDLPEDETGDFLDIGLDSAPIPMSSLRLSLPALDMVLQRRTSTKQPRQRRVTLVDLIKELRRVEAMEDARRTKSTIEQLDRRRQSTAHFTNLSTDNIFELAHDEFIESTVLNIKALLEALIFYKQPVTLSQLEIEGGLDRVSAYLALLFLSVDGDIEMDQPEFYGEITVKPGPSHPEYTLPEEDTTAEAS